LNRELIQAFHAVKREPYKVLECIRRLPVGSKAYYRVRAVAPAILWPNEAAARFVYLNRYCF
jgi:DNA adenine methylase